MGFSINKDNYEKYKEVSRILFEEIFPPTYWAAKPPEAHPTNVLERWEREKPGIVKRALKEGLRDAVSMLEDCPPEVIKKIDQRLSAADLPSVSHLRSVVRDTLGKVLKRGQVKNLDEFYVVKEILDNVDSDLPALDRERLSKAMFEFEFGKSIK
ncbi:MAG: hypothetical protein IPH53_16145 [Flavobacteriales bacterium]|nr:hypothetical protein [Flavobacteriales bacterium]MBK7086105.1 hypothetical protein [Flavobacteriales bacterium]MBK7753758.1 hypothetical protein [Flavobacteriales bacterium]MBK9075128.1 hypothetical protein [Flavobacteriales bacterium]MBK9540311.1 hypothetical protein [Flavobacteriales bacterium]